MATSEFQITGMTCSHCEKSVREEVSKIADIDSIDVSSATGKLIVSSKATLDTAAVIAAVDEAGYQAVVA